MGKMIGDFLTDIFINSFMFILNRSMSILIFILAVLLVRILFRKMPKKYMCFLWILVFLKLAIPGSMVSTFSLNPFYEDTLSYSRVSDDRSGEADYHFYMDSGIEQMDQQINQLFDHYNYQNNDGAAVESDQTVTETAEVLQENDKPQVTPIMKLFYILSFVWISGVAAILLYSVVRMILLKKRVETATCVKDYQKIEVSNPEMQERLDQKKFRIFESDQIESPFLFGFLKPVIYLPLHFLKAQSEKEHMEQPLCTKGSYDALWQQDRNFVILHEQMHIMRRDHIVKPILFFITCLYWFHPLVWFAFFLFSKDVEMAVDEAVCRCMEQDVRADYAQALLNISVKQSHLYLPLAFGESHAKERIKHVLSIGKAAKWIPVAAVVVIGTVFVCFGSTNTREESDDVLLTEDRPASVKESGAGENEAGLSYEDLAAGGGPFLVEEGASEISLYANQMQELVNGRISYVGDAPAVGKIVQCLSFTKSLYEGRSGMEIITSAEPYELIIPIYIEDLYTEDTWLSEKLFYVDSILAFSGIKNLGICTFRVNYIDKIVSYRYDREVCMTDYASMGYSDFYEYSQGLDSMHMLYEQMNLVINEIDLKNKVEIIYEEYEAAESNEALTVMVYRISKSARMIERFDLLSGNWENDEIALSMDCEYYFSSEDFSYEQTDFDTFSSFINSHSSVGMMCRLTIQDHQVVRVEAAESNEIIEEIDDEIDEFPPVTYYEDVTHDGVEDRIVVNPYFAVHMPRTGMEQTVQIYSGVTDELIWYGHADSVHPGWSGYYIYQDETGSYLLNWEPEMWQGDAVYTYRIFSLTETGTERELLSVTISFDLNDPESCDPDAIIAYVDRLNEYLSDSYVLIDTNDGINLYSADGSKLTHAYDDSSNIETIKER